MLKRKKAENSGFKKEKAVMKRRRVLMKSLILLIHWQVEVAK